MKKGPKEKRRFCQISENLFTRKQAKDVIPDKGRYWKWELWDSCIEHRHMGHIASHKVGVVLN